MKYRIFYDDSENSEVVPVEVDALELATALFRAGMQAARNGYEPDPLTVLRVETEVVTWKDVELP